MALSKIQSESMNLADTFAFTGTVSGAGSNIKEQLAMLCDGNDYTVSSGTYTSTNVTAFQEPTQTYSDVNGSSISYTPPSGSVCVLYEFIFQYGWQDVHAINNFRFYIDSDEVTNQRTVISGNSNPHQYVSLRYVIPIGGTASTATGRQATWTTAKTLKLTSRGYTSSNDGRLFNSKYWDGAGANIFNQPKLIVTAYG
jgi:hypothetical protein